MNKRDLFAVISEKGGNYHKGITRELSAAFAREGRTVTFCPLGEGTGLEEEVAQALKKGYHSFLAVGGDGTVNLLAGYLYGKSHRLGIVPAGTTNTLARVLGIPLSIKEAIEIAASSDKIRAVDGLEANGRLFVLNVSVGLTSISLDNIDSEQKSRWGVLAYILGIIRNSRRIKPRNFDIRIDGDYFNINAAELHVTNTGVLGTPRFRLYQDSLIDDGKAEVLILRHWSLIELFNMLLDALTHRESQAIRLVGQGRDILIQSKEPITIQADGDVQHKTPVRIKVLHRAINFIVP